MSEPPQEPAEGTPKAPLDYRPADWPNVGIMRGCLIGLSVVRLIGLAVFLLLLGLCSSMGRF